MPEVSQRDLDILENLVVDRIEALTAMRELDAAMIWKIRMRDIFGSTITEGQYRLVRTDEAPTSVTAEGEQPKLL